MTTKTVHFVATENYHTIDESTTLDTMKDNMDLFFNDNAKSFFNDESYQVYRGQLIVFGFFEGSNRIRVPKITVYAYLTDENDAFHLESVSDEDEANAIIDRFVDQGKYEYGMFNDILDGSFFDDDDWDEDEYTDSYDDESNDEIQERLE